MSFEELIGKDTKKLGFGLMRLPLTDPMDGSSIDIDETCRLVDYYIEHGFTYFDTAIMYCGMKSEDAVKPVLVDRYPRDSFTLADKMHYSFFNTIEEREQVFDTSLRKTGAGYFDYYLIHDVGSDSYTKYTATDTFGWAMGKKAEGIVKHVGFSFHDSPEMLDRVLTEHPEMEFVQLQINYLDWDSKGVRSHECYDVAARHGKPVIVMEPVKGGTLVNVSERVTNLFKAYDESMSVASWAIRFAVSHENVVMVLSGMSTMEQVVDNTSYMSELMPLTDEEKKLCLEAAAIINEAIEIPCTGCGYCLDGCPKHIAIPKYFSLYNTEQLELKTKDFTPQGGYYNRLTSVYGKASDCVKCRKCEHICPQHLEITGYLEKVAREFEE